MMRANDFEPCVQRNVNFDALQAKQIVENERLNFTSQAKGYNLDSTTPWDCDNEVNWFSRDGIFHLVFSY